MITILTIHISLAIVLLLAINYFGGKSRGFGYVSSTDILGQTGNFGFNFLFRILTPSIYISAVSILFYYLGMFNFVNNIYLIVLYYILINFIVIILLNRWSFVNKTSYFVTQFCIFLTAYLFYSLALSKGLNYILPEAGNFRTELWLLVLIYLYDLAKNYYPENSFYKKRSIALVKRFKQFEKKYFHLLKPTIKDNYELYKIFFAIMLVEDLNRPVIFRFLEKIIFPIGFIQTSGIMQVKSKKYLSDEESINLAQEKILKIINFNQNPSSDELIQKICKDYNGLLYFEQVNSIYHEISYPAID